MSPTLDHEVRVFMAIELADLQCVVPSERFGSDPHGPRRASANDRLIEPLTDRELEVLRWVAEGEGNQDVADRLGIALATVKFHMTQIFGKLGFNRRTQVVVVAVYLGIVRPQWLHGAARRRPSLPPAEESVEKSPKAVGNVGAPDATIVERLGLAEVP